MIAIPPSHLDLLDRALPAALTTEMPDGRLQTTVVWYERERDHVLLNTMREFQKARNLRDRPRATVLVVDPDETARWIEIRGDALLEDDGALDHLDGLARRYTGTAPYFGAVVDADLARVEHPLRVRLVPAAVVTGRRVVRETGRTDAPAPVRWNERGTCETDVTIPASHEDLLGRPLIGALATRLPDGRAQTQPVWYERDGHDVLVHTTRERRKGRNLEADPRATLLIVDPDDSARWIEIRADVDLLEDPEAEGLDRLTRRYTKHEHYYGSVYPPERRHRETRVIARLHPRRVVCDAIHG
ncbi:MAG TPA: TIGR03618 family F420-dependent PPOX class oxidoreductase [Actinomycetota bacterium]